ncbi:probable ubiquitin-conjugating enzyme E2 24 [Lotus japonicus]|uniref:probable ubiquitin-conjugating enzyme E2 24 n=1 Tax=Lotus japonicus TaxID=34305 RepID=UPI002589AA89|nr:probable ubiquitin-conjugating enzyme E2 24 [Lotus japonicus]
MEEMKTTNEFRNFDIVSEVSDHHFLKSSSGESIMDNPNSEAHKRIMKEWETLEQNLPESIYVRVYNNRIDLMRAAIIGDTGTPYHDGLFFFDIALPSYYPHNPPKVHFISFGNRIHSFLRPDGKVFLMLLNTHGTLWERWDPSFSTLPQVLLSLKALVHREKLYDRSFEMYEHTCRLSLQLLLSPPEHFEAFVNSHFRDRAPVILSTLTDFVDGRCGNFGYASVTDKVSSPEILKWAEAFYPVMVEIFRLCGAPLDASFHRFWLTSLSWNGFNQSEIKKRGILKKVMKGIKSVF